MTDVDVVVVGTGPAGGMAAWKAAENGASVVVVDKKEAIGEPVRCAEGTLSSLLNTFDMGDGPWITNYWDKLLLKYPPCKQKLFKLKTIKGLSLDRALFEKEICKRAREHGAEIKLNEVVTGLNGSTIELSDGTTISGKVVIGADGVESMVGRWAGITQPLPPNDLAKSAQYLVEGKGWDLHTAEFMMESKIAPGGYFWIFPKSDTLANIGLITTASCKKIPDELLKEYLQQRFPDLKLIQNRGGCVPVGPPLDTVVRGSVALAGDAARFASAFGAGGIHSALFSGAVVGRIAAKAAHSGDMGALCEYDRIQRKCLYPNLKRSYKLKKRVYSHERYAKRMGFSVASLLAVTDALHIDLLNYWWGRLYKYV